LINLDQSDSVLEWLLIPPAMRTLLTCDACGVTLDGSISPFFLQLKIKKGRRMDCSTIPETL